MSVDYVRAEYGFKKMAVEMQACDECRETGTCSKHTQEYARLERKLIEWGVISP